MFNYKENIATVVSYSEKNDKPLIVQRELQEN